MSNVAAVPFWGLHCRSSCRGYTGAAQASAMSRAMRVIVSTFTPRLHTHALA